MQGLAVESSRVLDAEKIIELLQTQQYLHPHKPLETILQRPALAGGIAPQSARRALAVLGLEPQRKIGRLKRSELLQLARTIYRLCRPNWAYDGARSHSL